MTKKRLWILIGLVVALFSASIYLIYFSKPAPFPSNEQLVEEINAILPEKVVTIQDTLLVDEYHVLVPFISNNEDYGLSYWIWQNYKWRVASINTKGQPRIWKIDKNDPSSYYFVWNIHPKDQLSSIQFYLIRDRGYYITEGIENYYPRVQMEKEISLEKKSYGLVQLPDEWGLLMNSFIKVESAKQPDLFFNDIFARQSIFFGWIPYDQTNKETFPERSVNGGNYLNGKGDIEHLMILDKRDIELSDW